MAVLLPNSSGAWSVYNESSRPVRARVLEGDWDVQIEPGRDASCHWSDTDCNPLGLQSAPVTLQIETLDGDTRDFNVLVAMEGGGYAVVRENLRPLPWLAPGNLFVEGYRADGQLLSLLPYGAASTSRNVRFLISADCQFCSPGDCTEADATQKDVVARQVNQHMIDRMNRDSSIRGICYAGDLTQFASGGELEDQYKASISGYSRYVFDGLGNHDLHNGRSGVREYVTERKRVTIKTEKGNPHYSWEWHDVHLVQLNLMPADQPAPNVQGVDVDFASLDPMGALTFLQVDLALHVGGSGRPVILIHHYGFEEFSIRNHWWTEAQRLAYWNAIASYNVVAIFTGHSHLELADVSSGTDGSGSHRFVSWMRPANATGGPASIPTFVSGAALYGAYLEVELNNANQLRVALCDQNGEVETTKGYERRTPIWLDSSRTDTGYGWKDAPYSSVSDAVIASSSRFSSRGMPSSIVDFLLQPGTYSETVRIDQPTRLTASAGGTARIGP